MKSNSLRENVGLHVLFKAKRFCWASCLSPTYLALILLRDGKEVDRLVRPLEADEVRQLLSKIS